MADFKKPIVLQQEGQDTQAHDIPVVGSEVIDARYIAVKDDPDNRIKRVDDGTGNFELVVNSTAVGNIELDVVPEVPNTHKTAPALVVPMRRTGKLEPLPEPQEWGETEVAGEKKYVPLYSPSPNGEGANIIEWSAIEAQFVPSTQAPPTIEIQSGDWVKLAMDNVYIWDLIWRPDNASNILSIDWTPVHSVKDGANSMYNRPQRVLSASELVRYFQLSNGAVGYLLVGEGGTDNTSANNAFFVRPHKRREYHHGRGVYETTFLVTNAAEANAYGGSGFVTNKKHALVKIYEDA